MNRNLYNFVGSVRYFNKVINTNYRDSTTKFFMIEEDEFGFAFPSYLVKCCETIKNKMTFDDFFQFN